MSARGRSIKRRLSEGLVVVYGIGFLADFTIYVWAHWGEVTFWNWGTFAYYAITRSAIWPVWLALDLIGK